MSEPYFEQDKHRKPINYSRAVIAVGTGNVVSSHQLPMPRYVDLQELQNKREIAVQPTLIVIGVSTVEEAASTTLFIRVGFVRRADPAPLLTTISIGHPMLISMKSTEHSCSISSTVFETVSGYAPQI